MSYWRSLVDDANLLLAYGGNRDCFDLIEYYKKIFIPDPNLRTLDHQREGQSYTAIFKEVSERLQNTSEHVDFITLFEFDHLPLIKDFNERQVKLLQSDHADILAYHLTRVDETSHPHYLSYAASVQFDGFFRDLSVRDEPGIVLSMFGTGSCWRREAFDAVAAFEEPFPIYFEIYLPTLAHHLGFRLRNYGAQNVFVSNLEDRGGEIERARNRGAWTLHPVKNLPATLSPKRSA